MRQRCPMLVETGDMGNVLPPLRGNARADVCIVGGGYLGLWTALEVQRAEPALSIAIVEADICGGGASGRNSGMALSLWAKIEALVALCGAAEALRLAQASQDAIGAIADFAQDNHIDIEFAPVGWLWASTCARHDGRWNGIVEALDRLGQNPFEVLDRASVQERVEAPGLRCGVFDLSAATLQPAKLVRGLRRVALERGIAIFENTAMTRLLRAARPEVITPQGRITAGKVVLAMNAWATQIPELGRGVFVITSDDAVSAPAGDALERCRWRNGPIITNSNTFVAGYRTTRDGRVVAGVTGGAIPFGALKSERFDGPSPRRRDIADAFETGFGRDAGVRFVESWRGPIDRTRTGLPVFGTLAGHRDISFGYGFSGNGIVGCRLGAEILRSLVLDRQDEWTSTGLVRPVAPWMPREPVRYVGAHLVRAAIRQRDSYDHQGRDPGRIARALADLAPGGIVTTRSSE